MSQVPVVEKQDHKKGIIAAVFTLLLTLFILFFIKYSEPDPPKVTIPIPISMAEEGIEEFDISNAGGGAPSETQNTTDQNTSAEEQPTQDESSVTVPEGSDEGDTESSTPTEEPSNPFSGSGSGGQGSDGSGGGFGADEGPGEGDGDPGLGTGERLRYNDPPKPKTPNSSYVTIVLVLTVDSRGVVVQATLNRERTTTTNQRLINEVIDLTKEHVKYEPIEGARNQTITLPINVEPR